MDLLHTGCKVRELVLIETNLICLYIKGKPYHPSLSICPNEIEDQATYRVRSSEAIQVFFDGKAAGESSETTFYYQPLFYEQQNYEIIIENKQKQEITFDHDKITIRDKVSYMGRDKKFLTGILNFKNEIGYTDLRININGKWYLTLTLEIFPSKISYKSDYKALLQDVNEEIYNLSFDFLKSTYVLGKAERRKSPSLTEFYSILQVKFEELKRALGVILKCPHHELGVHTYISKPKGKYLNNNESLNYLRNHPWQVQCQKGKIIPTKALHVVKQVTYDTPENQLIKYWIKNLIGKLDKLKDYYQKLERRQDSILKENLLNDRRKLKGILHAPMFLDVSEIQFMPTFSLVLQMAPGYTEVYKIYNFLMRGLSLLEGEYQISNKNVAEIYEYWCFIKLGALLREKYQLISTDLIKVNSKGIFVRLKKGEESVIEFKNPITKERFKLKYNAKGKTLPTVNQKPDNILELKKEMQDIEYKYIFDAKYKVEYGKRKEVIYTKPTEEDINTMHRYRDAIVYDKEPKQYERTVFGAFVLFPGREEKMYKEDQFFESIEKVGIGGFPFLPSTHNLLGDFLEKLVEQSGHAHYKEVPIQEGLEKYIEDLKITERNVLVAPVRSKEQLEGIKKYKLYHIPLENIRKSFLQFQYVAIYEGTTSKIEGGIYTYGKVKSLSVRKRKELLKHFSTSRDNLDEDYIVYEIEEWINLKQPILATGYGISQRMYTNKGLLDYATVIPELSIKTREEFQLYLEIKRASEEYQGKDYLDLENKTIKRYVAQVGDKKLYFENQTLVCEAKENIEKIPLEVFFKNPRKVLRQITYKH